MYGVKVLFPAICVVFVPYGEQETGPTVAGCIGKKFASKAIFASSFDS
jgi:hypothetical protein